jgi:hypothetical protein
MVVQSGTRTPQWVEQAGKGGKRKPGRLATVIPSAPPLRFAYTAQDFYLPTQLGRARNQLGKRPTSRLPPFPACSIHAGVESLRWAQCVRLRAP